MSERRKKMIEVALPLEAINRESAREKSIRHGHPSTLHLWWARRPLAACRAVLFASMVDDPDSDPMYMHHPDSAAKKRAELFNLIEELVKWENSNNPDVLNRARAEIARCFATSKIESGEWKVETEVVPGATAGQVRSRKAPPDAVNAFLVQHAPPVYDPFCGGGSIPLEAQRLGLRAYASDLNPVPVLITKALIEIPPKFSGMPPVNPESRRQQTKHADWSGSKGLAEDVRYYGKWMRDEAEKRIGHLYPKIRVSPEMAEDRPDLKPYLGQELTVIAWIWARTVQSSNPAANGAHVPLVRSFWLSQKPGQKAWIDPKVDHANNSYRFEIRLGEPLAIDDPSKGTVKRTGATCLLTESPISFDHIRDEGKAGRMKSRLMAIVAEGARGRVYLEPIHEHELVAGSAKTVSVPETPLPDQALSFRVQLYGINRHRDLFTPRQLSALALFSDLVAEAHEKVLKETENNSPDPFSYANAIATYLSFAISKVAEGSTNLCTWSPLPTKLHVVSTFGRQALPMIWDFAEANVFAESSGNIERMTMLVAKVIELQHQQKHFGGHVTQHDATTALEVVEAPMLSTDPPYYDNIGYADLSDFFYVWLRRSIGSVYPDLFRTLLTPKSEELIATPYRFGGSKAKAQKFFEEGLGRVFQNMRQSENIDFPMTVFYAFKQSETDEVESDEDAKSSTPVTASTGWETMLEALIKAKFLVTGTWPMRTERAGGFRNKNQNALASSIVLVCRSRASNAPSASRRDFIAALRRELPEAFRSLQQGNIAPVDLAQAAIGPGMAVFSRYAKVIESDGSQMGVRTALQLINQALDQTLSELEGEFDSDTRWAISWFDQHGVEEGPYGTAETLSTAKNTSVKGLEEAGIVVSKGGKVRLLRRDELPTDWDPASDKRLTIWEVAQHLIHALDKKGGEAGAAALLRKVGDRGEVAKDLAYRLYTTCERKKWAQEAMAYNSLVIAWSQISRLAYQPGVEPEQQGKLFD